MSNTVITNYTDLNGPSSKADSSVVVIVNKDGSLSVDQNLLGTLMGSDGSQAAGISVVRVGHEGRPDDATDSESDDDKVPHVTLSVDSYFNEPNSIIKYDSGAEMLQSLKIETRENSLLGFQNDHCYTLLISPGQELPQRRDSFVGYDDPVIEITHTPPPKPIPVSKKISILDQKIIPKAKTITTNFAETPIIKGNEASHKPLPVVSKTKQADVGKNTTSDDNTESSSSSGESIPDRDSDSDYKDSLDRSDPVIKQRKPKIKPRILKVNSKIIKADRFISKLKTSKATTKRQVKEKTLKTQKKEASLQFKAKLNEGNVGTVEVNKVTPKQVTKLTRKEKKTPAHVSALLSDMTSLFSTPDVIRRVSTDSKNPAKSEKELNQSKSITESTATPEVKEHITDAVKPAEHLDKIKQISTHKTYVKQKEKMLSPNDKILTKSFDLIPQLDDASLAQILQDTSKPQQTSNTLNSPSLAGPLSPTLDLLGGLQPEEEAWTEDLLRHVAQLVENSPNLQEVIDKQVQDKVDTSSKIVATPYPQTQIQMTSSVLSQSPKSSKTGLLPKKDPIEIVRRDGRIITLPPIEAPTTRASKRKNQLDTSSIVEVSTPTESAMPVHIVTTPEPQVQNVSKQYVNKKLAIKKQEPAVPPPVPDKILAESQDSWNSEDDPNRLWCICKQPHNNRFMICCDGCEDWFHGKCVNITKVMGQQMEEQGIEWRCPNCVKKSKSAPRSTNKTPIIQKRIEMEEKSPSMSHSPRVLKASPSLRNACIVCKKQARPASIYCSDACILKHAQDSLGPGGKAEEGTGRQQDNQKTDSRVIVYERKTGRVLAGPNAPTPENLKIWLQKNPTFEVVRPGTLSSIKPNMSVKKSSNDSNKIQTMLNFEKIPRKPMQINIPKNQDQKELPTKVTPPAKELKSPSVTKTPTTPKNQPSQFPETPKASTSSAKQITEPRKIVRTNSKSQTTYEKNPSVSPAAPRRKETPVDKNKMTSVEPVRENVRKALMEQLTLRMAENTDSKFTDEEIQQFANSTELELHELFKDVGMKYKAKYRSLMFNIKDRKNQSLWKKICDRSITPKQLVRLTPEELASQELAEWRDQEAKHQLELIKKTELDLLAASKTYVLKTHKGEEVMVTKESVSTELDPNISVEDLVPALNESTALSDPAVDNSTEKAKPQPDDVKDKKHSNRKKDKDRKKKSRESKRESTRRSSRSSRRTSELKEKEERSIRHSDKRSSRARSSSKEKAKADVAKGNERTRHRSRSRVKSSRRSRSRSRSRSSSKARSRSAPRSELRPEVRSEPHPEPRSEPRAHHAHSDRLRRSRSKHSSSTEDTLKQRSKSQDNTKGKIDSTDSDSIERPKSAMLKELHPEYDPHEPMITSAISEEDLGKSREDIYDDSYNFNAMGRYEGEYDSGKDFQIQLPNTVIQLPDKISEPESDQEPSSTVVDHSSTPVWNGCINMVDVARFYVAAHEVSGSAIDLEEELSAELDIVGRINPDTVWDYIGKMKRASNKDIIILKLQAANDEEKMQYFALYSYLSSRNRLGVVKVSNSTLLKDFYIVPLPAHTAVPSILLPFEGPGLGDVKTHLLIAIVIRQRKKRLAAQIPKDIIPAKVARESQKRSYTPPMGKSTLAPGVGSKSSLTPPTSPRRRTLPLPAYSSPALSTTVKDKIAASLAAADDEEAYSPGSSTSSGDAAQAPPTAATPTQATPVALRSKMEELNRQIEEQKQQIRKMAQADSSNGENEAYSPSRPMTPPGVVPLADIALPSNLQEILATIKQRTETSTSEVDSRSAPIP